MFTTIIVAAICCIVVTIAALHLKVYLDRRRYNHFISPKLEIGLAWILGHLPMLKSKEYCEDTESFNFQITIERIRRELHTKTLVIHLFTRTLIYTVDIPLVSKVLSNHRVFLKRRDGILNYVNGVRVFGSKGILTEPGTEVWYHKRKAMDPAFQKKFLRILVTDINKSTNTLCASLEGKENKSKINIYDIFMRVALEVVCTCGFSLHEDFINAEEVALNNATNDLFFVLQHSADHRYDYWVPWKYRQEKAIMKKAVNLLRTTMAGHLQQRIDDITNGVDTTEDILSYIIKGNMQGDKVTLDDIVDDFLAFVVAGMETTAITMSILMWFIVKKPDVYQKLLAEVNDVYGDESDLDFDDLNKLVYLEQCIKETLRIHPPAQLTGRVNYEENVISGEYFIPKGSEIFVSMEAVHHSEDIWPNPLTFDPDRFAPNQKVTPFTFIPFTAGPRICIGKHFAVMEMKIVISKLLHEFQFYDGEPGVSELAKITALTSRPKHGVFVGIAK